MGFFLFFSKQYFSEEYRSRRLHRNATLSKREMAEMAEIRQKQEKPSRQYVSDLQSLQDERHLFFLVSKLPDKNIYLSSLSLIETLHTEVSKNSENRMQSQARLNYAEVHPVSMYPIRQGSYCIENRQNLPL